MADSFGQIGALFSSARNQLGGLLQRSAQGIGNLIPDPLELAAADLRDRIAISMGFGNAVGLPNEQAQQQASPMPVTRIPEAAPLRPDESFDAIPPGSGQPVVFDDQGLQVGGLGAGLGDSRIDKLVSLLQRPEIQKAVFGLAKGFFGGQQQEEALRLLSERDRMRAMSNAGSVLTSRANTLTSSASNLFGQAAAAGQRNVIPFPGVALRI